MRFCLGLFLTGSLFACAFAQEPATESANAKQLETVRNEILGIREPSPEPGSGTPQPLQPAPQKQAEEIVSNPLYRENIQGETEESWIDRAFKDFAEWFENLFGNRNEEQTEPRPPSPGLFDFLGASGMFIKAVIFLLLAALAGFVIYMLAKIRIDRNNKAAEGEDSLVSEEEAKRSADQWLTEADRLSQAGDYRAAIRCLYLACLTRLDQNRVLRFERHETNWEHLHRFRDLVAKPSGFDLTPPTHKFDEAWYGFIPQTADDVEWFKGQYQILLDGLKGMRG